MKFCKRPVEAHELALSMAISSCSANCDCSGIGVCNCSPTPTHQIQYNQINEGRITATLQETAESLVRMTM